MQNIDDLQKQIMDLMVLLASNKIEESKSTSEQLRIDLNEALDHATTDQEVVRLGKFIAILDQLEVK